MNKAQRRAHIEPACHKCGSRVIPIWKDARSPDANQPDWRVSARQCSRQGCSADDALDWPEGLGSDLGAPPATDPMASPGTALHCLAMMEP